MKYIIKDIDGHEHGPIDEETLAKWVDEDRVTAETQIRSEMLPRWKPASQIKLLNERLQEQAARRQKTESSFEKTAKLATTFKQQFSQKKEKNTTFVQRHKPHDAGTMRRFYAWIFDLLLIGAAVLTVYAGVLFYAYYHAGMVTENGIAELREEDNLLGSSQRAAISSKKSPVVNADSAHAPLSGSSASSGEQLPQDKTPAKPSAKHTYDNLEANGPPYTLADMDAGYGLGSKWVDINSGNAYICLSGKPGNARWVQQKYLKKLVTFAAIPLVLLIIFYYSFCYGYFAQTFGMWYWGIFVTKKNIEEVYFFRAFIYTLTMFVFGILTPAFIYLCDRGLHDLLVGVRVIEVAGSTKD